MGLYTYAYLKFFSGRVAPLGEVDRAHTAPCCIVSQCHDILEMATV